MTPDDLVIPKYPISVEASAPRGRLIGIGDVHGCLDELKELLTKLNPTKDDTVVFLGDLVDRGPCSAEVVELVAGLCRSNPTRYLCTLGNHDEKHVRYRRHLLKAMVDPKYTNPMRMHVGRLSEHLMISDENCLWMARLPAVVIVQLGTPRLFTHAGLIPGWELQQPTKGLIRNRCIRKDGDRWAPMTMDETEASPQSATPWHSVWAGNRVIYGHNVHDLQEVHVENDCFGIDTGVCFGGHLTAYVEDVESARVEYVQVKAARVYHPR